MHVDFGLEHVTVDRGVVWVATVHPGTVLALNSDSLAVEGTFPVADGAILALAASGGLAFASDFDHQQMVTLSTAEPETSRIDVPVQTGIAASADDVWVACCGPDGGPSESYPRGRVTGVSVESKGIEISMAFDWPQALAYAYEHVWVLSTLGTLTKADPTDLSVVDSVALHEEVVLDVAAGGGAIWVAGRKTVYAFDPATLAPITSTEMPENWSGQIRDLTGDDRLLVAVLTEADRVVAIDARTGQRIAIYELEAPTDAALDNGILWVVTRNGSIYRIETAELRE